MVSPELQAEIPNVNDAQRVIDRQLGRLSSGATVGFTSKIQRNIAGELRGRGLAAPAAADLARRIVEARVARGLPAEGRGEQATSTFRRETTPTDTPTARPVSRLQVLTSSQKQQLGIDVGRRVTVPVLPRGATATQFVDGVTVTAVGRPEDVRFTASPQRGGVQTRSVPQRVTQAPPQTRPVQRPSVQPVTETVTQVPGSFREQFFNLETVDLRVSPSGRVLSREVQVPRQEGLAAGSGRALRAQVLAPLPFLETKSSEFQANRTAAQQRIDLNKSLGRSTVVPRIQKFKAEAEIFATQQEIGIRQRIATQPQRVALFAGLAFVGGGAVKVGLAGAKAAGLARAVPAVLKTPLAAKLGSTTLLAASGTVAAAEVLKQPTLETRGRAAGRLTVDTAAIVGGFALGSRAGAAAVTAIQRSSAASRAAGSVAVTRISGGTTGARTDAVFRGRGVVGRQPVTVSGRLGGVERGRRVIFAQETVVSSQGGRQLAKASTFGAAKTFKTSQASLSKTLIRTPRGASTVKTGDVVFFQRGTQSTVGRGISFQFGGAQRGVAVPKFTRLIPAKATGITRTEIRPAGLQIERTRFFTGTAVGLKPPKVTFNPVTRARNLARSVKVPKIFGRRGALRLAQPQRITVPRPAITGASRSVSVARPTVQAVLGNLARASVPSASAFSLRVISPFTSVGRASLASTRITGIRGAEDIISRQALSPIRTPVQRQPTTPVFDISPLSGQQPALRTSPALAQIPRSAIRPITSPAPFPSPTPVPTTSFSPAVNPPAGFINISGSGGFARKRAKATRVRGRGAFTPDLIAIDKNIKATEAELRKRFKNLRVTGLERRPIPVGPNVIRLKL